MKKKKEKIKHIPKESDINEGNMMKPKNKKNK